MRSHTLFNVRPGEMRRTLALFGHLLITIACLIILKSASSALFLERQDPSALPYLYIAGAVVVSLALSVSTRFMDRLPRPALIVGTTLFFITNLVLFWSLTRTDRADAVYPVLYLWVEVYGTAMAVQFWTFAGDVFTGRQGRRLFGLVGAGGLVGSILGGGMVSFLAKPLGSENLLLLAGVLLLGIPPLVMLCARDGQALARVPRRGRSERQVREVIAYFRRNRYPWLLAAIAFTTVVTTTIIDYQFKILAAEASLSDASLARFLGQYNAVAGFLSLGFQVVLTSFVLNRLGVFWAVAMMPLALTGGSAGLLAAPPSLSLLAASGLKLLDSSLSHSVDLSGKQLLYVALPERLSGTLLSFIEGVVGRIGLGFAGVLLLLLTFFYTTIELTYATLGFCAIWLALAVRTRVEYRVALQSSLREGGFDPARERQINLDRTTRLELLEALGSGDESRVLVALDFLERTDVDISPHLRDLLRLPSPEIHVRALRLMAEKGERETVGVILPMLRELPSEVTAEAVEAIGRLAPEEAASLIRPFLGDVDPRIRGAAIRAVLADGRWDAYDLEALNGFEEMLGGRCGEPELCRVEAARALADAHLADYRYVLLHFLYDGSLEVQRMAIAAAGRTHEPQYLPILMAKTLDRSTREQAIDAIAEHGESVLPQLEGYYESADGWKRLRKNVIRITSEIGTAAAANLLLSKVKFAASSERYDLIKALNRIREEHPDVELDESLVEDAIFRETEDYYRNIHYLVQLGHPVRQHLVLESLQERLLYTTERVSRLLALIFPPNVIFSIYRGLHGRNVRRASNAHELLDELIDRPAVKRVILPMFDDLPPEQTLAAAEDQFAFVSRSVESALEEIIQHSAPWLKLCALYFAGTEGIHELRPLLEWTAREDADPAARATAQRALELLDAGSAGRSENPMDTLVEKVLFLKEVEIFSGLTAEDLTELADYLTPVTFAEGETIFEEGDSGDALYIVVSGRVNLSSGGRYVESRGAKASIGELSAVDQGPRTFTAVAGTPLDMLEIDGMDLSEILQENADISRMMLYVMAGRVRRYMQLELKGLTAEEPHVEPAL